MPDADYIEYINKQLKIVRIESLILSKNG